MTPGLDKTPHPIMGYVTPGLDKKVRLLALQHNKVVKTYECDDPVYSVEFVKASLVISTETEVLSSLSRRVCMNFESISGTRARSVDNLDPFCPELPYPTAPPYFFINN